MFHWWKCSLLRSVSAWVLLLACCCGGPRDSRPANAPTEPAVVALDAETTRAEDGGLLEVQAATPEAPSEAEAAQPAPPPPPKSAPSFVATSAGQLSAQKPATVAGSAPSGPQRDKLAPAVVREPGLRDTQAPLLIYTAILTLAVFGVDDALERVEALARDAGGYLLERNDVSISVRIPAPRFQSALAGIGKIGDELHRQVSARDVTDEHADLEIRLRNAEVMRQRLEALLARANNVEEALSVERELERVAEVIERIKGRLKVLGELVAFSTVTVHFQARRVDSVKPTVELPFPWLNELGLNPLLSL